MKKKPATDVNITCEVFRVLRSDPVGDTSTNRVELRIVKWSGGKTRVLEKRRVWNLKDGTLRCRQLVGLSADDVECIVENKNEIITILQGVSNEA